jgi:hypothetical protein
MKNVKVSSAFMLLILLSTLFIPPTGCTEFPEIKVVPPPPAQQPEVQCPEGCFCLTKEEADKLGYELCQGQKLQCSVDKAGNPMYCFQKPVEAAPVTPVQCPPECFCLTKEEAAKSGFPLCQGQLIQCGTDQSGNPMYCFTKQPPPQVQPTPLVECPKGCFCLTKEEADKLGYELCQGQKLQCSVDKAGNPLYCFQKPAEPVQCPQGCVCLTKDEAAKLGYQLCGGQAIQCGTDQSGNPMYCFQKPAEQVQCPQGCVCLSKEEGYKLGYQFCGGQAIQCGKDQAGNPLYCFQKPQ